MEKNNIPKRTDIGDYWLDSSDVKRMFNISDSTLYRLRISKEIPFTKIGGKFVYPKSFFVSTLGNRCRNKGQGS